MFQDRMIASPIFSWNMIERAGEDFTIYLILFRSTRSFDGKQTIFGSKSPDNRYRIINQHWHWLPINRNNTNDGSLYFFAGKERKHVAMFTMFMVMQKVYTRMTPNGMVYSSWE